MTIIEIRPFRNGWQVCEAPHVQPVFSSQEEAIDYAACRVCFRSGEIRIQKLSGAVERIIRFDETERKIVTTSSSPSACRSGLGSEDLYGADPRLDFELKAWIR